MREKPFTSGFFHVVESRKRTLKTEHRPERYGREYGEHIATTKLSQRLYGEKGKNMTNIQKKAARAAIIEEIEHFLISEVYNLREQAKDYQTYATDEETGEIDTNDWHYQTSIENSEKADIIETILKDLEKF